MSKIDVGVCVYGDLSRLELPKALNALYELYELFAPGVTMAFPHGQVVVPADATGTTSFNEQLDKDDEGVVGTGYASDGTEIRFLSPLHVGQQIEFTLAGTLHVTITRNDGDQGQPFRMKVVFMLRRVRLNSVAYAFMDIGSPPVIRNATDEELASFAPAQS